MVTRKKRTVTSRPAGRGLFTTMAADFIITALLPILTTLIAEAAQGEARAQLSALDLDIPSDDLFIALILVMLMFLGPLSVALGGSLFNPSDTIVLWTNGKCTFNSFVLRSLAQVAGALSGSIAVFKYLPSIWARRGPALVATPAPGIDIIGGASSEFLLTYFITLLVMATQRSSRGRFIKYLIPLVATAVALKLGSRYSGPALNPAVAFGLTYLNWDKQPLTAVQHLIVFWVAPISASILASFTDKGITGSAGKKAVRAKTD